MNMAANSEPNTMIPATAATQKTRRPATCRSYRGFRARRCRMKNAIAAAAATIPSPIATVPSFGTEAKLIETMRAPTKIADTMPPRLSTGSLVSLT